MKKNVQLLALTDNKLDAAVKIQGTKFDRKRKISDKTINKMLSLSRKGKTYYEISKDLGISITSIRYNIDPEFKLNYNKTRNGAHTGKDHISKTNRVAYKRQLIADRLLKV